MAVRVYQPKCSIVLKKNIGRTSAGGDVAASERFKGAERTIDLTPYLGSYGSVTVSRSVREPAGLFSIVLADMMVAEQYESLYGLIEPMDVIEIRMARDTSEYFAQYPEHMPIMMRGFVSNIGRSNVMTDQGPRRAVKISGQDYGKILQIMRILYLPTQVLGQELLTTFKLYLNYGIGTNPYQDPAAFAKDINDKVVTPFIDKMREKAGGGLDDKSPVQHLLLDATVKSGTISPFGAQDWPGGTVYDLLRYFGDVGPWNELFVEDRDDGPYIVFRPTPFKDIHGKLIQEGAEPEVVTVTDNDLVDEDLERSDANVANYYWVDAARYQLIDGAILTAAVAGGDFLPKPLLDDYPNSSPDFYGLRTLQVDTQQGPRADGQAEEQFEAQKAVGIAGVNEKRRILIENNKDNVVLEAGTIRLMGNEKIKAGRYLRLERGNAAAGGLAADYYVHRVTHNFALGAPFTTAVTVDRGTGFIERIQRERGSGGPYLLELSRGGVYAER